MLKLSVANVVQSDFPECPQEEIFSFQQKPQLTCRNERNIGACLSLKNSCEKSGVYRPERVLNNSLCSSLLGHVPQRESLTSPL